MTCNPRTHGKVLDVVRKSDTMTWIVCADCKRDGKISPVAWWETTQEELMQRPNDEELQKYV